MACKCGSERIVNILGHCVDECCIRLGNFEDMNYVPDDMEIGGGDDLEFSYCLDCGKIQGEFPVQKTKLEKKRDKKMKRS